MRPGALISHAASPPRPRSPGVGHWLQKQKDSRIPPGTQQNGTEADGGIKLSPESRLEPSRDGTEADGGISFPNDLADAVEKTRELTKEEKQFRELNVVSIYTVATGPWELWCGRLLRPNILFLENRPSRGTWNLQALAAMEEAGGGGAQSCLLFLGPRNIRGLKEAHPLRGLTQPRAT